MQTTEKHRSKRQIISLTEYPEGIPSCKAWPPPLLRGRCCAVGPPLHPSPVWPQPLPSAASTALHTAPGLNNQSQGGGERERYTHEQYSARGYTIYTVHNNTSSVDRLRCHSLVGTTIMVGLLKSKSVEINFTDMTADQIITGYSTAASAAA